MAKSFQYWSGVKRLVSRNPLAGWGKIVRSQRFLGWFDSFGSFQASEAWFFVLLSARKGRFRTVQGHHGPHGLHWNCAAHQVPHAHQVVSRAGEREDPIDLQRPAMPQLAQQRNGLQPTKTFFDTLPLLLTDGIPRVSRLATINSAAASSSRVLRHVRRHPNVPALAHEIRRVETLVAAHCHPPASRN